MTIDELIKKKCAECVMRSNGETNCDRCPELYETAREYRMQFELEREKKLLKYMSGVIGGGNGEK